MSEVKATLIPEAKPEAKPGSKEFNEAVAAAVNATLAGILPQIVMGVTTGQSAAILEARQQSEAEKVARGERCSACSQLKIACKGEHVQAVVYPGWAHPSITRWYRGQWVNGINYRSRGPGHFITIPKTSDILTEMAKWAKTEEELQLGRARSMDGVGADGLMSANLGSRHV